MKFAFANIEFQVWICIRFSALRYSNPSITN